MHVEGKGCSKVYTFITIRQILQIRQLTVRQTSVSPLYRFQLVKVGLSSGVWSYSDESSRFFQFFRKIQRLLFKKYPLKFSKLKNQGPFILNEAMPDLMVAFLVGLISEEVEIFVSASLAMKLREYTRNTPIRRNPVSKFQKKFFLTVIF